MQEQRIMLTKREILYTFKKLDFLYFSYTLTLNYVTTEEHEIYVPSRKKGLFSVVLRKIVPINTYSTF